MSAEATTRSDGDEAGGAQGQARSGAEERERGDDGRVAEAGERCRRLRHMGGWRRRPRPFSKALETVVGVRLAAISPARSESVACIGNVSPSFLVDRIKSGLRLHGDVKVAPASTYPPSPASTWHAFHVLCSLIEETGMAAARTGRWHGLPLRREPHRAAREDHKSVRERRARLCPDTILPLPKRMLCGAPLHVTEQHTTQPWH